MTDLAVILLGLSLSFFVNFVFFGLILNKIDRLQEMIKEISVEKHTLPEKHDLSGFVDEHGLYVKRRK